MQQADSTVGFPVIALGASAGGLEALSKLLEALPSASGAAFVIVQHLDPSHESMLAGLLAAHTEMAVQQATDAMLVEPDHVYVIPPGAYLAIGAGSLHLSVPRERHGLRLPFDFFLHSLAASHTQRAVCIVLSGTGADGTIGSKAIREQGGLVIAQDPSEAAHDGMPQSAIRAGAVDLVLAVEKMPEAIARYRRGIDANGERAVPLPPEPEPEWLHEIIELLRNHTAHDFRLYKPGTLLRRTERRMAIVGMNAAAYLKILRESAPEREQLAKELLINVTSFFRDSEIFDRLAQKIIPDLVRSQPPNRPLRIWTAGCSTGEETYSLTMLFFEEIAASERPVKLQLFASDVDGDAIATAREGLYPEAIEATVSAARLARFFVKEEGGYRVIPELRSAAVFTVQDLLTDPPFSQIDLVSCRNLLIYLRPESQDRVLRLFHFALRDVGILLLGGSETVGDLTDRFEPIDKDARIYRHVGRARVAEVDFSGAPSRALPAPTVRRATARTTEIGGSAERMLLDTYAPPSVLVNQRLECLYFFGALDPYLHVASGEPSRDILALARQGLRHKLRALLQQARRDQQAATLDDISVPGSDGVRRFSVAVQPVAQGHEHLLLVSFIATPERNQPSAASPTQEDLPRIAELEQELDRTRKDLHGAIRDLETSNEEQKGITEEAMSMNEEFQATNEELVTSKEELQSLNEELTALNGQLQEALGRQRSTSNDLQNILDSSGVATIFLDNSLFIRFFTPAAKSLFRVIATDIGRPLADLTPLAADKLLFDDAALVLQTLAPIEREIRAETGLWYVRRILPYHTQDKRVEGVVITFVDTTERKDAGEALQKARRQADQANLAKSRFLAAASHDLRQPLQTLNLLHGLLAKKSGDSGTSELLARQEGTLDAMSGMLDTLLDINQLEAGIVPAEKTDFAIADLLNIFRDEFAYLTEAHSLGWRVVPSRASVRSDPRLLEQIVRNLLSNAVKYTRTGRILLGCRRRGANLRIEVWDTGPGIPEAQLGAIFDEFHQLDNPGRDRNRGLGLGLAIVQRLADLLGHRLEVRSRVGKGSVFSVEIPLADEVSRSSPAAIRQEVQEADATMSGTILVVENDPALADILKLLLDAEGHRTVIALGGGDAEEAIADGGLVPDLVIADYNLAGAQNGAQVVAQLRRATNRAIPAVILTGDISTDTLRAIADQGYLYLHKPIRARELTLHVQQLLMGPRQPLTRPLEPPANATPASNGAATVFVIDDDRSIRAAMRDFLWGEGWHVEIFPDCETFLRSYRPGAKGCLVLDDRMPGMSGIELLQRLRADGHLLPTVMFTGHGDVRTAVQAMKAGAMDFLEKPVGRDALVASITRLLEQPDAGPARAEREKAGALRLASLSTRERDIMDRVLAGHPSKNIAADLKISQRTVENHRAALMRKMGAKSLPEFVRLALAAQDAPQEDDPVAAP
jgi:two-component system CheB/CheR fusion protein